jgi:hypothetical protein
LLELFRAEEGIEEGRRCTESQLPEILHLLGTG